MNDLDKTADNMARATAISIVDHLKDTGMIPDAALPALSSASFINGVAKLLRDEDGINPCHDWIGEALQRRQECADLIRTRGEYYDRACRAENMLARVLLQPENEPLREGARLLVKELDPSRPIPSEGNTRVLDPDAGKWIVFYPDDLEANTYVITSLSETMNIRSADNEGLLMDDIANEYAHCHVLGDAVMPLKSVEWNKVIPEED